MTYLDKSLYNALNFNLKNPLNVEVLNWLDNRTAADNFRVSQKPSIEVYEDGESYVISTDLPGISRDSLTVTVTDRVLKISAERRRNEEKHEYKVIREDVHYGQLSRSLKLGADVDETKIEASFVDGVLRLILPKTQKIQPRTVNVKMS